MCSVGVGAFIALLQVSYHVCCLILSVLYYWPLPLGIKPDTTTVFSFPTAHEIARLYSGGNYCHRHRNYSACEAASCEERGHAYEGVSLLGRGLAVKQVRERFEHLIEIK